jgi:hypothetical protein
VRARFPLLACLLAALGPAPAGGAPPRQPAVAELLEDDADGLLAKLKSRAGDGRSEAADVYSGARAIKVTPMQVYDREVPGWKYRIVEKPGPDEYRYLRFAWKADGCAGVMLQMHDARDWVIRYTAGQNTQGWETKFVADQPPADWVVVTRDLYADFGERTIQGLALTAFGGKAAYFDHIYFGRTVDDLDRVDATGAAARPPEALAPGDLAGLWDDLGGPSAPRSYAALWRLQAAPEQAVPFLRGLLTVPGTGPDAAQLRRWVADLDAGRYATREAATAQLAGHLEAAAPHLREALGKGPSPEQRERAERLLAGLRVEAEAARVARAVRVLEFADTPAARKCLEDLARGPEGARPTAAARAALRRLAGD